MAARLCLTRPARRRGVGTPQRRRARGGGLGAAAPGPPGPREARPHPHGRQHASGRASGRGGGTAGRWPLRGDSGQRGGPMCSGVGVGGAGWDLTEGAQGGPAGNGPRPGDWEQPERAAAPGCGQAMLGPGAARAALPGTSSGCIPSAAWRPCSSCARGGPVLPTCARRSGNLPMSPLFWVRPAALPLQAGPTCLVLGLGVQGPPCLSCRTPSSGAGRSGDGV